MNFKVITVWLDERGIELEESFVQALRNLAAAYKKENNIKRLEDVYNLIGVRKQYLSHWESNPSSTQTKKFQAQCYPCCC